MISNPSSEREALSLESTPSPRNSAGRYPTPIPSSNRPLESISIVAVSSATRTALCKGSIHTPVAILIC